MRYETYLCGVCTQAKALTHCLFAFLSGSNSSFLFLNRYRSLRRDELFIILIELAELTAVALGFHARYFFPTKICVF